MRPTEPTPNGDTEPGAARTERARELARILDRIGRDRDRLAALVRGASPDPVVVRPDSFADLAQTYRDRLDPEAPPYEASPDLDAWRLYGGPWLEPRSVPTYLDALVADARVTVATLANRTPSIERAAAVYAMHDAIEAIRTAFVAFAGREDGYLAEDGRPVERVGGGVVGGGRTRPAPSGPGEVNAHAEG